MFDILTLAFATFGLVTLFVASEWDPLYRHQGTQAAGHPSPAFSGYHSALLLSWRQPRRLRWLAHPLLELAP